MANLVKHKAFGTGIVQSYGSGKIVVRFNSGDKMFVFPDAFDKFLSIDDSNSEFKTIVKEALNTAKEKRIIEEKRAAEAKRIAEERKLAEEKRIAEEQKIAREKRIAKEKRIAEERRIAEAKRIAEEKRIAKEKQIVEEKRIAEEKQNAERKNETIQSSLGKSATFINILRSKYNINLNMAQRQAVSLIDGPVLLLAVPGSGKTTVLISRLANMLLNFHINPSEILTLTFSKRSAADMKQRYESIFKENNGLHFSTIHSFCNSVVVDIARTYNRPKPKLIDNNNILISNMARKIEPFVAQETVNDIITKISYCNNRLAPDEEKKKVKIENFDKFEELFNEYRTYKREKGLMDYDDMLLHTYKMFADNPESNFLRKYQNKYKYVCVDEAQDTSPIQNKILDFITAKSQNIFMVGDEDQSIYGFRGADPTEILNFENKYKNAIVLKMEENFRSTKQIVEIANTLILNNKKRMPKKMFANHLQDVPVHFVVRETIEEQYDFIEDLCTSHFGSMAALFRYKDEVLPLVYLLEKSNACYTLKNRKEIPIDNVFTRTITGALRLIVNKANFQDFEYFYKRFCRRVDLSISVEQMKSISTQYGKGENIFNVLQNNKIEAAKLKNNFNKIKKEEPVTGLDILDNMVDNFFSKKYTRQFLLFKCVAAKEKDIRSLLAAINNMKDICQNGSDSGGVVLSTIHSSKGLEFDNVVLTGLIDGLFPSERIEDTQDPEEETRLCYVAITRARKNLCIVSPSENSHYLKPSKFIAMMKGEAINKKVKDKAINKMESRIRLPEPDDGIPF